MSLEERVVKALAARKWKLACAESCTGGLFGARLTRIPGAGDVFRGGIISYEDAVKAKVLGVERSILEKQGAVSRAAAARMAEGARDLLAADISVSITGFAGPDVPPGGELGRVFIGLAHAGGVEVHDMHFAADREAVREGAVTAALEHVLTFLNGR